LDEGGREEFYTDFHILAGYTLLEHRMNEDILKQPKVDKARKTLLKCKQK
jgi:hypothetical protein